MAKSTVYLTQAEVTAAAISALKMKPEFSGKHIAEVAMVLDNGEVKFEVIMFDTMKAAMEYGQGNPESADAAPTTQGETPHGKN